MLMLLAQSGVDSTDQLRYGLVQLLIWVAVIATVIWVISAGVRSGVSGARAETGPSLPALLEAARRDHEAAMAAAARPTAPSPPQVEAPGWFEVVGVDRDTRMDVREHVYAATPANARAKVELSGVAVTAVTRLPSPETPHGLAKVLPINRTRK